MQQDKPEITTVQEVPGCPDEAGPAVLEVLPDSHVQLPSAIVVLLWLRDGRSLLIDLSEAGAPVSTATVG